MLVGKVGTKCGKGELKRGHVLFRRCEEYCFYSIFPWISKNKIEGTFSKIQLVVVTIAVICILFFIHYPPLNQLYHQL